MTSSNPTYRPCYLCEQPTYSKYEVCTRTQECRREHDNKRGRITRGTPEPVECEICSRIFYPRKGPGVGVCSSTPDCKAEADGRYRARRRR